MPSIRMEPDVGSRTLSTILMVVVFPAPLGPSKPTISLRSTSNEIPSTAIVFPYFFDRFSTESTLGIVTVYSPPNLGGELRESDHSPLQLPLPQQPLDTSVHSCEIVCCHETNFIYHDPTFDVRSAARRRAGAVYRSATDRHHTRPKRRGSAWRNRDVAFRDDQVRAINHCSCIRSICFSVGAGRAVRAYCGRPRVQ